MKTAYPQTQNPCSIRLYSNIPFDNTYQNHSLISRLFTYNNVAIYTGNDATLQCTPKERFIDRKKRLVNEKYYPRYDLTGEFNFNFKNGLIGSVTLNLTPAQTNANYMRLTCGSDVYYYFITGIEQVNFETYNLSLELDVLMTYQDEFLEGVRNNPVFTQRKHCHRYNENNYPHCADFKANEESFAGNKPNIFESKHDTKLKGEMGKLDGIWWLYVCIDGDDSIDTGLYNYGKIKTPLTMICCPLTNVTFAGTQEGVPFSMTLSATDSWIKTLVGNGKAHGCKISPYPPFMDNDATVTLDAYGNPTINSPHIKFHSSTRVDYYDFNNQQLNQYKYLLYINSDNGWSDITQNCIIVKYQDFVYDLDDIELDFENVEDIDINSLRVPDARLLFEPFKKYVLTAPYGSEYTIFPELVFSNLSVDEFVIKPVTSTTCYIGDNTINTYFKEIESVSNNTVYANNQFTNVGLSASMNYIVPVGTNALDVFNATQAQSFYTSKVASGITSGLTIAGGVGSIALGIVGAVGSMGMSAPASAGLIAGGATAIGSGVASAVNVAKSTNAKIEDLNNTPDSVNSVGSTVFSDFAKAGYPMPYIITYTSSTSVLKSADDLFYQYGYAVSRECHFNTELKYNNDNDFSTDDNIFGRTIFNFIQTNEDITNKINSDIPLLVKQKLSNIFKNGITLWTFFGVSGLWDNTFSVTTITLPDKWFLKCDFNNTEYKQ